HHIPSKLYSGPMAWEVEYSSEFGDWWETLGEEEQIEISAKVELLEKHGPVLPRPHADVIVMSKHSNMKELRGRAIIRGHRSELRILYAFDPRRTAILLIGGDKTGNPNWYNEYVPLADKIFDQHLREIAKNAGSEGKTRGKKV